MAVFLTKLVTSQTHNKKYLWETEDCLVYVSDIVTAIVIPKGFIFDKNSVPKYLRWIFPVSGRRSDYAAAVHDWLYSTELYPREVCDAIYLEIMQLSGVSAFRARSKYLAVKLFGGKVWDTHTRESLDLARGLIDIPRLEAKLAEHGLDKELHKEWNLTRYPVSKEGI